MTAHRFHQTPPTSSSIIGPIRRRISSTSMSLTAASCCWSLRRRCHPSFSPPPQEATETLISTGTRACAEEPLRLIMGSEEQALARRLQKHVEELAGKIGERNVFCPTALQAAASYIEHEWQQQGYAVRLIAYDVSGV